MTRAVNNFADIRNKLEAARLVAGKTAPYGRQALSAAALVIEPRCPTMGVDKHWRVYANPDWCAKLTVNEIAWVWLHEVLGHLVRRHCHQSAGLDPQRANIAQDLEIESLEWPAPAMRPQGGQHPKLYGFKTGLHWREYYSLLPDDAGKQDGAPDCGSGSAGDPRDWEQGAGAPGDAPAVSEMQAKVIAGKTAQAIKDQAAKGRGSLPAGLEVWANEHLSPPRPDWRAVLRRIVGEKTAAGVVDKTGATRERREILDRKWVRPVPRVAIVADTSGSMGGEGSKVLGVIRDALQVCGEIDIAWTDSSVVWQRKVRRGQKVSARGGGGTDLREAIAQAVKGRYDLIAVVTDCDTPWPAVAPRNAVVLDVTGDRAPSGWRTIDCSKA